MLKVHGETRLGLYLSVPAIGILRIQGPCLWAGEVSITRNGRDVWMMNGTGLLKIEITGCFDLFYEQYDASECGLGRCQFMHISGSTLVSDAGHQAVFSEIDQGWHLDGPERCYEGFSLRAPRSQARNTWSTFDSRAHSGAL